MTDKSDRNAVSCDLQLDWPTKWRKQVFYVAGQIIGFALEWPKHSFDQ